MIELILFFVLLFAAIIFHEVSHLLMISHLSKERPYLELEDKDFIIRYDENDDLTTREHHRVALAGILGGAIPLVFALFWLQPEFSFIAVGLYALGCKHDFKELGK